MKYNLKNPLNLLVSLAILVGILEARSHPVLKYVTDREKYRHKTSVGCTPGGVVAGVLRNDGKGWYALNDDAHKPVNISAVESDWKMITVKFPFAAKAIHTFVVSSDETLTVQGVTAGASVASDEARLKLGRDGIIGTNRASPLWVDTDRFPGSNLWVYGVFDAQCPAGT